MLNNKERGALATAFVGNSVQTTDVQKEKKAKKLSAAFF